MRSSEGAGLPPGAALAVLATTWPGPEVWQILDSLEDAQSRAEWLVSEGVAPSPAAEAS